MVAIIGENQAEPEARHENETLESTLKDLTGCRSKEKMNQSVMKKDESRKKIKDVNGMMAR